MRIQTKPTLPPSKPQVKQGPPQDPTPHRPFLDKATITTLGSTAANASTAAITATVGNSIPHAGLLTAVASGVAGGVIGGIVGGYINYKACDYAESKYPSSTMNGLVTMGMGVMSSVATGIIAGAAGNYGASPLTASGVAAGTTAAGWFALDHM